MPAFDILRDSSPDASARVREIIEDFDLNLSHVGEHFTGSIDIEGKDWNVGLIVGGSGTGKSTIAREVFGDQYVHGFEYTHRAVVDDMPSERTTKEIELAFTRVGFASPPSWLRPYNVLSNGEKMRVDLARALLEDREVVCFDEFTSVVNREVAKTAAYAISKAVKSDGRKFVAVTCHKDVIDWLEPDWIYDTDEQSFFGFGGKSTAPRSGSTSTGLITRVKNQFGEFSGSITI